MRGNPRRTRPSSGMHEAQIAEQSDRGRSGDPQSPFAANAHLLLPVLVFAVVWGWFVSNGTGDLFERESPFSLEAVYDGLGLHLSQGRFDIPPGAIMGEGFLVQGRTYTYFPPTPALPRILLNFLWPDMHGRWAKLLCLVLALATLLGGVALLRSLRSLYGADARISNRDRLIEILLVVAAGLGSTLTFLLAKAIVYHEAELWGVALATWSVVFVVRYWGRNRRVDLAVAGTLACLAFFSRASSSLGVLALLAAISAVAAVPQPVWTRFGSWGKALVAVAGSAANRQTAAALAGLLVLTAGLYLAYNKVRWGEAFNAQPFQYYVHPDGTPLTKPGNRLFIPDVVPRNLVNYWIALNVKFVPEFPWVNFGPVLLRDHQTVPFTYHEPQASVAAASPALALLFLTGLIIALRRVRQDVRPVLLIGTLFAGTLPTIAYFAVSERYVHDLYPVVLSGACFGLLGLRGASRGAFRAAAFLLCAAALYSSWVCIGLSMVYQREIAWAMPEARRYQLAALRDGVDLTVASLRTPLSLNAAVPQNCHPAVRSNGDRLEVYDCATRSWRHVMKPLRLEVMLPPIPVAKGLRYPVVTLGASGASDRIYAIREHENSLHLGLEHWSTPPVSSAPVPADKNAMLHVVITIDTIRDEVRIAANGVTVLSRRQRVHNAGDAPPQVGQNPFGAGIQPNYPGGITVLSLLREQH